MRLVFCVFLFWISFSLVVFRCSCRRWTNSVVLSLQSSSSLLLSSQSVQTFYQHRPGNTRSVRFTDEFVKAVGECSTWSLGYCCFGEADE